ncbi:MAG: hypothetical protein OXN95_03465 [bacterium]|nr:hypothetical protein [bacterium]
MSTKSLEAQARQFASDISDLLNNTVTDGIRISTATTPGGRAVMGRGVTDKSPDPKPIPISPSDKKAAVFLYLLHSYEFDPEGVYLTMTQSTMSLYTSPDMEDDQLIVGIDYARNPGNQFPGAHLHVAGQRDDLDAVYLGDARKTRKLRDLHFPVGGKRFRPSLEDLVEFMITEEMVEPRPGWEQEVKKHRARWEAIQLKAAVRRNQKDAATALREAGWDVTPPGYDL